MCPYNLLCAYVISDSIAESACVVIYLPKLPETTRGDKRGTMTGWLGWYGFIYTTIGLGASHMGLSTGLCRVQHPGPAHLAHGL